jgi:hypothetical protein
MWRASGGRGQASTRPAAENGRRSLKDAIAKISVRPTQPEKFDFDIKLICGPTFHMYFEFEF